MADGRKNNGAKKGENRGQGRKKVHDELLVRDLSQAAIMAVYGGLKEGFIALLKTEEPTLVKFVWEHAVGKPADKLQHSTDPDNPVTFTIDGRFKEAE